MLCCIIIMLVEIDAANLNLTHIKGGIECCRDDIFLLIDPNGSITLVSSLKRQWDYYILHTAENELQEKLCMELFVFYSVFFSNM